MTQLRFVTPKGSNVTVKLKKYGFGRPSTRSWYVEVAVWQYHRYRETVGISFVNWDGTFDPIHVYERILASVDRAERNALYRLRNREAKRARMATW